MDHLYQEVLLEYRKDIVIKADPDDVFLGRLLDHLMSKRCIQVDQKERIKREIISKERCGKLLDFVSSEGHTAFLELCNALDEFGTNHSEQLADKMRKSLEVKD